MCKFLGCLIFMICLPRLSFYIYDKSRYTTIRYRQLASLSRQPKKESFAFTTQSKFNKSSNNQMRHKVQGNSPTHKLCFFSISFCYCCYDRADYLLSITLGQAPQKRSDHQMFLSLIDCGCQVSNLVHEIFTFISTCVSKTRLLKPLSSTLKSRLIIQGCESLPCRKL